MKVIILAGGMGTRLREETEYRPKPLVQIGALFADPEGIAPLFGTSCGWE